MLQLLLVILFNYLILYIYGLFTFYNTVEPCLIEWYLMLYGYGIYAFDYNCIVIKIVKVVPSS